MFKPGDKVCFYLHPRYEGTITVYGTVQDETELCRMLDTVIVKTDDDQEWSVPIDQLRHVKENSL